MACRFRLCRDIMLWPFDVTGAEYFSTAGALQALGVPVGSDVVAGLQAVADPPQRRAARRGTRRMPRPRTKPETWFAGCRTSELPIYLVGAESDGIALYEQTVSPIASRRLLSLSRRFRRSGGDRAHRTIACSRSDSTRRFAVSERQPGLSRLGTASGIFRVSAQVPWHQSGRTRSNVMPRLRSKSVDILFAFDEHNSRLAAAVRPDIFSLYTAPAINLFEKTSDRIPDQVEHPRISRGARPQSLSRIRAASGAGSLRAFPGGEG